MELSNRHRQFLIVSQCGIQTVVNFLINGLIAWLIHRSSTTVAIWDASGGILLDLLLTGLALPFFICVIVSPAIAGQVRSGKVPPLLPEQFPQWHWFRRSSSIRGLVVGIAGVIFGAGPVVWALILGQSQPFPMLSYVLYKAVWAAMLASVITPIIGWWALANASRKLLQNCPPELRKSAI